MKTYTGVLALGPFGEGVDILFLSSHERPLAEELQWMCGKRATVRYWITNAPATKTEAQESFIRQLSGDVDGKFESRYSEITGYLWTDENLTVGGHDLIAELKSYAGKYLILEIEANDQRSEPWAANLPQSLGNNSLHPFCSAR